MGVAAGFGLAGDAAAKPGFKASSATAANTKSRLGSIIKSAVPPQEATASPAALSDQRLGGFWGREPNLIRCHPRLIRPPRSAAAREMQ